MSRECGDTMRGVTQLQRRGFSFFSALSSGRGRMHTFVPPLRSMRAE
jgi:hypothetical protein